MKAFISYSHRDETYLNRLHVHLSQLKRQTDLTTWYDRELIAGDYLDESISKELLDSDLFIALVSPDFIASEYCYTIEMKKAFEMQLNGSLRIVAIIVEPCDWRNTPLKDYLLLPKDGKEVSSFTNENAAFLQVAQSLRAILLSNSGEFENKTTEVASPKPLAITTSHGIRSRKRFDRLDKSKFRDTSFEGIISYFQRSLDEIDAVDGLETMFDRYEKSSFTATIANRNLGKVESITVHSGSDSHMGDIYYSSGERSPKGTSNGGFGVESDDYELFLKPAMYSFTSSNHDKERCTTNEAAEILMGILMKTAGLDYARD